MALIPCPECRQSVSDAALSCPHCGFVLTDTDRAAAREEIEVHRGVLQKLMRQQLVVALLLVSAGVLVVLGATRESGPLAIAGIVTLVVCFIWLLALEGPIANRRRQMVPLGACPNCGGVRTAAIKDGFDVGAGCCGVVLFGPLGLLCGMLGDKTNVKCLKCAHEWRFQ